MRIRRIAGAGIAAAALVCVPVAPDAWAAPVELAAPAAVVVPAALPEASPSEAGLPAPSWAKVSKKSKTSLRVWWAKVPGAEGYQVSRWDAKEKRYMAVKTLKGASKTSWVDTRRKTGKKYTYQVAAYRTVDGAQMLGAPSYWVSAVPYKKHAKVVNAGAVVASHNEWMSLLVQDTLIATEPETCPHCWGAYATPSKASKAKQKRVVDESVRFHVLTGKDVIRVSPNGAVFGEKPGKAKVRLYAHNGTMTTVTLHVRDFARQKFDFARYPGGSINRVLLEDRGGHVSEVAALAERMVLDGTQFPGGGFTMAGGKLVCRTPAEEPEPCAMTHAPDYLLAAIQELLTAFPYPMDVLIGVYPDPVIGSVTAVEYDFWTTADRSGDPGRLTYDPALRRYGHGHHGFEPATHWYIAPAT
jgi:hypothetical protein